MLTFSAMPATAQKVWDGGAGTNLWTHAGNWNPDGLPGAEAVSIDNVLVSASGDMNGDGIANNQDISAFVLALTDPAAFAAAYPWVNLLYAGDINGDGAFNNQDIAPFVAMLTGGGGGTPILAGANVILDGAAAGPITSLTLTGGTNTQQTNLTLKNSAALSGSGPVVVGQGSASTYNLLNVESGSTFTFNGSHTRIGFSNSSAGPGYAELNLSGAGSAVNLMDFILGVRGKSGVVNQSGGSFTAGLGAFQWGAVIGNVDHSSCTATGNTGTYNLSGGTATFRRILVLGQVDTSTSAASTASGSFIQSGGTVTVGDGAAGNGLGNLRLGAGGTGVLSNSQAIGLYKLTGGSLTVHGDVRLGSFANTAGTHSGSGTFELGDANGTGIFQQYSTTARNLVVRDAGASDGTLTGWGTVAFTGTLTNNGQVIANGFGTVRSLDLSSFSAVASSMENGTGVSPNKDLSGWYAINKGKLILPGITMDNAAGTFTCNLGEAAADSEIDLVNSVRVTLTKAATSGTQKLNYCLYDRGHSSVPAFPDGSAVIGVWDLAPTFAISSANLVFRYDNAMAAALGLAESSLLLYRYDSGSSSWVQVANTSLDSANHRLTATGVTSFSSAMFAIGILSAAGTNRVWDGGAGTTNWMHHNNWNPDGLPNASTATIDLSSATVQLNALAPNITSLSLGQSNSVITPSLSIGQGGSLTATASVYVGSGRGSPTLDLSGDGNFYMQSLYANAGGNFTGGAATINLRDSAALNAAIAYLAVRGSSTTVNQSGGTFTIRGTGSMVMANPDHVSISADTSAIYNLSGGTLSVGNVLMMGYNSTPTASIYNPQALGRINQTGGTVNLGVNTSSPSSTVVLSLGHNTGSFRGTSVGIYQLTGGTLNVRGNVSLGQYNNNTGSYSGYGTFQLGDAAGTGVFRQDGGLTGAARNLTIRVSANSDGTFTGWGLAEFTGILTNNGQVIADGLGTSRTLDMSRFASVNNTIENNSGSAALHDQLNGWYAVNGGQLLLPALTVNNAAGTYTLNLGEAAADTDIDLVNAVRMTFTKAATAGTQQLHYVLLDRANSQVPILPSSAKVIGIWNLAADFPISSADIVFRYDLALAQTLGLDETDLNVYRYNPSLQAWEQVLNASLDSVKKQLTASGIANPGFLAIGMMPNPQQADLLIADAMSGQYHLDNIYQTNPHGKQVQAIGVEHGRKWTWTVRVQNDGLEARRFLLKAAGAGGSGWTVNYLYNASNLNADILSAGWLTPSLEPGAFLSLAVEVTPDGSVAIGASKETRLDVYLEEYASVIQDSVKGVCQCADVNPDLLVRNLAQGLGDYGIDNTYQTAPSGAQIESAPADRTVGAWYRVKLQNDGTVARNFLLKASGAGGSGWTVKYLYGSTDVTAAILGSSGLTTTRLLAPGEAEYLSVLIQPDNTVTPGASREAILQVFGSPDDATVRDAVKCVATATSAKGYYASPAGSPSGNGSWSNPWDLQTALNHPAVVMPGDTIWLRGGTYGSGGSTLFTNKLKGNPGSYITVRSHTGEWAIIDGGITDTPGTTRYTILRDFEITNSSLVRTTSPTNRPPALNMFSTAGKAVNLIIHDAGHPGIGGWSTVGDGGEVDGCLLWGTLLYDTATSPGTPANPWARGSGIYTQNQVGTRYIRGSVFFRNYNIGIKVYTEGGYCDGFYLEGNVSFDNGMYPILVCARDHPVQRLQVRANYTYRASDDPDTYGAQVGYFSLDMIDALFDNNYFADRILTSSYIFYAKRVLSLTVTNNTLINYATGGTSYRHDQALGSPTSWTWNNNTYYNVGNASTPFSIDGVSKSWNDWKTQTGFDAASTMTTLTTPPNRIAYRPSPYQPGRSHLTIYNWSNLANVAIDLAQCGLERGDTYEIRDAQNYFAAPILTGTVESTSVNIPMRSLTTVAQPIGNDIDQEFLKRFSRHTAPYFGVFVVIRTNAP